MADLGSKEKLALINENLAEVLNPEIIEKIIAEGRSPRIYWGTATTGRPHAGYFVPAIKIAQFLAAGCDMVILLADIHGFLDNLKAPIELVQHRVDFYRNAIISILRSVGVSTEKLTFVLGSSYQKSPDYVMDVYRLCSLVSEHDAKKAGAEVVKQSDNCPLSGLLYPVLQVLDEQYLNVDAQFGGVDQRKLFAAAKEWLPRLGYKQRAHLLNPMVPGLHGGKMSASDPDSKIDLLDPPEVVRKKIRKAVAIPKEIEGNGILAFTEYVLLPVSALKGKAEFRVPRERDGLEPLVYTNISQMHHDYANDILTPQLLKPAVAEALIELMAPIQEAYKASPEWQEVTLKAYPPAEPPKKEKKKKDKGSRYPGGKDQQKPEAKDQAQESK
ncbi:tyrosyl-tRNA synthetase [Aspergillus clavatus NRRL 1]|uniref:Tyrosine--tRNA ligase n=1 Tax=Aspergillus clavatus (strain ATCC 1007 / CBS 513.65 / DSM 816 / NCTC 3887 / NRRL 1 / QM 1276 / 107) TaxID=344612 RepID=A1C9V8_ASPCL|nr:tyrosyl-tRNA synthetase [Aspergillus clavatus NRRL 1]EAW12526.1 tyrosyl-tRNA synthetase [Aspergillus clavatus NRRL 1]